MKCPNCGKENREIAHFCQYCGEVLKGGVSCDGPEEELVIDQDASVAVAPVVDEPSSYLSPQNEDETALIPDEPEQVSFDLEPDIVATEPEEVAGEGARKSKEEPTPEPVERDEQMEKPSSPEVELEEEPSETTPVMEVAPEDVASKEAEIGLTESELSEPALDERTELAEPLEAVPGKPVIGFEAGWEDMTELELDWKASEEEVEIARVADKTSPELKVESVIKEPAAEVEAEEKPEEVMEEELPAATEPDDVRQIVDEQALADVQTLAEADALFWRETPEPMEALALGMVVNGRYQISEVLAAEATEILYRVRDLMRCSQCGFADNSPDQAFCSSCGAMLDQKPLVLMLERPVERVNELADVSVEDYFQEKDRAYWVWRESEETAPLGGGVQHTMRLVVGQKSDVGRKRELDEDSLFVLIMEGTYKSLPDQLALFVVADGMGGHEGGDVASKLAVQTLVSVLVRNVFTPELGDSFLSGEEIQNRMIEAMEAANDRVYLERKKRESDMGTTMTAALLRDWMLYLAHVGDCRAYRWGEEGLQQLTTDHSIVASMVAAGTMQPDEIYTHPQRSVIYRSIGDRPSVDVDFDMLSLNPGDRLLLCCDGLWEMIRDEGIEGVMLSESDPQTACDVMVERANAAGGIDNISVIVVQL